MGRSKNGRWSDRTGEAEVEYCLRGVDTSSRNPQYSSCIDTKYYDILSNPNRETGENGRYDSRS